MAIFGVALLATALSGRDGAVAQDRPAAPAPSAAGPIAALQQELKQQGFAPGPVNGVMTEQTRRALDAYLRRATRPPQALGGMADPVRRAQAGLQRLGLLAGPVDGVVGPATRDAIIRFEAARRLPIDPRVSDSLLAALDEAGAAAGAPAGSAPAGPAGGAALAPPTGPAAAPPPGSAAAPAPPAAAEAAPDATGRQPLPPGVTPPPIR
jgi:peptidoglycan hydrolase-like protein with peptidoglycan-binding domain